LHHIELLEISNGNANIATKQKQAHELQQEIKVHLGGQNMNGHFCLSNVLVEVKNLFQVRGSLNQCWKVLGCSLDSQLDSHNENQFDTFTCENQTENQLQVLT
jgi:hypothetical protein